MADTNATFGPDDVETWTRTTQASRLEPITLLGALAAVTERIGLVATATTTYSSRSMWRGSLPPSTRSAAGAPAGIW